LQTIVEDYAGKDGQTDQIYFSVGVFFGNIC
jgi:hypothetical protein